MKRWMMVVVAGVLLLMLPRGGRAFQVVPLGPDQLVLGADVAFVGTLQSRVVKDGPPSVIEYTFKIENVMKGALQVGTPFVLRQSNRTAAPQGAKPIRVPVLWRVPEFSDGKTYGIFLGLPDKDGIRDIVGGRQGVLEVSKSADGTVTVMQEGLNNRFLAPAQVTPSVGVGKSLLPQSRSGGALPLNDFLQTIRKAGSPGGAQ